MRRLSTLLLTGIVLVLFAPGIFARPVLQSNIPFTGTVDVISNLRADPGTTFSIVDQAQPGDLLSIVNCNETCDWYQLETGAWIAAFLVTPVAEILEPTQENCDPSYPDVCIAPVPPDLDCNDITYRSFTVLPPDPHRFDGDGNGVGCESVSTPSITTVSPTPFLITVTATLIATSTSPNNSVSMLVASWNIESDGSDLTVVGERIADFEGVDLWGLSEVLNVNAVEGLEAAAEVGENANFESIVSRSGNRDRLVILYNAERFELLDQDELEYINIGGSTRAPLLIHVRDKDSQQEFVFMVNHLNRGNEQRRHDQAALLNEWAIVDERPALAVGDYNFDWEIIGGDTNHDLGYDYMTALDVWHWVRPAALTTTQCSGWPCQYTSTGRRKFLHKLMWRLYMIKALNPELEKEWSERCLDRK